MIRPTKSYRLSPANAPWIKCDTCGGQSAYSLGVECRGRSGRKGSRHLRYCCAEHARTELARLRGKK